MNTTWFPIVVTVLLSLILLVQVVWVVFVVRTHRQYQQLQKETAPTMWDVREVLKEGNRDLAVQLYCEIFNIEDIERARREVDELERNLKY